MTRNATLKKIEKCLYFETKALTTTTDGSTGVVSHDPGDVAGMDHYSLLFNLGVKWAF